MARSNTAVAQARVISARAVLPPDTEHYHRRVMAVVRYLNS
jgi:hypothetical protein